MNESYNFIIYTLGKSSSFSLAMANLKKICEKKLKDRFVINVVDLKENIQIAEDKEIWATPTLERVSPLPVVRIVGDLSDEEALVHTLLN